MHVATSSGGVADQQPAAVSAAPELAAGVDVLERGRDGRALASDELAEQRVREPQAQRDPARGHVAPALREVPEQHEQARLDRRQLQQGLVNRHPVRAADRALEQRAHHLRPVRQRPAEPVVENRQAHGHQHVPRGAVANEAVLAARQPGLQDVALADQLGGGRARQRDVPREQPVQHEEAEPAALGGRAASPSSPAPASTPSPRAPCARGRSRTQARAGPTPGPPPEPEPLLTRLVLGRTDRSPPLR